MAHSDILADSAAKKLALKIWENVQSAPGRDTADTVF
jgi:hypothetical protein